MARTKGSYLFFKAWRNRQSWNKEEGDIDSKHGEEHAYEFIASLFARN
jgi:hypothetical protein